MRASKLLILIMATGVVFGAGCRKNAVDKGAFKAAINDYYSSRQDCLWTTPLKFPAQADTSNDEQTRSFDALTDAGMLTRTSAEKKRFLVGSKQVNNYDLSDKGRTTWTADQAQPGYGNFCFGHPAVTAVDDFTPNDDGSATQYSVNYHYAITDVPAWANTAEMKTAFPKIAADTSAQQVATASLSKSSNGWQVVSVHPAAVAPMN